MVPFVVSLSAPLRAGDILRGGAVSGGNRVPDNRGATPAQAAQLRANATDALSRTTRVLQNVKNFQAAARAAAANKTNAGVDPNNPSALLPNVPDGLAPGGLRVATGLDAFRGADLPTQLLNAGKVNVTVKQKASQAFLKWDTFNVGKNTSLYFDQRDGVSDASKWIAFNQVNDPTGKPSQILGSIRAEGQVYVINQNGIIFGGASQTNTHTLVASALPINEGLVARGLLNQQSTTQFLLSALPPLGDTSTPPPPPPNGRFGDVVVQAGARLTSPTNASNVGGRVVLAGANVSNRGSIATPDGQTILAAGLQVGFDAHPSNDPSLRGLDAYVGQVGTYAGAVENSGLIEAARGNITLTGRDIVQSGALTSSTSVSLNGRIDLRAEFNAVENQAYTPVTNNTLRPFNFGTRADQASTGNVTLSGDSVIQILPELQSPDKGAERAFQLRSQVTLQGRTAHLQPNALIQATSGTINLNTGVWDFQSATVPSKFNRTEGQIYLDRDSLITAAGTAGAASPLSSFILTVALRGAELADAPIQRDNLLIRGQEITVDLRRTGTFNGRAWVGTPLADLTGFAGLVERSIAELTVKGGTVGLNSGGSVITQKGSIVDVSAGYYNVGSGTVRTTRLLSGGRLVDIANATPDRAYQGIYTGEFRDEHPAWGITNTYRVPWMTGEYFEKAHLLGADAGSLGIAGSSVALDATFLGRAISGLRQKANPTQGGQLALSIEVEKLVRGDVLDPLISPTPADITFGGSSQVAARPFALDANGQALPLREERVNRIIIDPALLTSAGGGFSQLSIRNPDGNIRVPKGVELAAAARGSITLAGANIRVDGAVSAPGGTLNFTAFNISPSVSNGFAGTTLPAPNVGRGQFTLGTTGSLNTAGLIIDQRTIDNPTFNNREIINGGSVAIQGYHVNLAKGSSIDVSGGAIAPPRGAIVYGRAGSVEIASGTDPILKDLTGGSLTLASSLRGFSGLQNGGGSLSLQAPLIQIGGRALTPSSLVLDPGFFSEGGFASFTLRGLGENNRIDDFFPAVSVADGVVLKPVVQSYLGRAFASAEGTLQLEPVLRPEFFRGPASIRLEANGVSFSGTQIIRGDIRIGRGALIETDPRGSVTLAGQTIAVYGGIRAPGGRISVSGGSSSSAVFPSRSGALATVYLAPGAFLDAAGKVVTTQDRFGNTTGQVLPGGSISVTGNIIAERGASLDVSGASGFLDLHPLLLGLDRFGDLLLSSGVTSPRFASLATRTRVDSAGGAISLSGGQFLLSDASLRGAAGGSSAAGGTLAVSSGRFSTGNLNTSDTNLIVRQSGPLLAESFAERPLGGIGESPKRADGTALPGLGYFAADAVSQGGFSSLTLGGNVEFQGPVSIAVSDALRVGSGGVIRANDAVSLSASYAALGRAFTAPLAEPNIVPIFADGTNEITLAPSFGPGSLTVRAQHIDVGNLSLNGIGQTRLIAQNGDIRGQGYLQAAGKLELEAAQVYPTTANPFNIFVYNGGGSNGSITITGSGVRNLPLSAGGSLGLYASEITQQGTLRAPFGQIQLGYDGTGTAPLNIIAGAATPVPIAQRVTLGAGSVTSISAIDPITGQGITIPYGLVQGGDAWIAPSGLNISALGPPEKRLIISALNVSTEVGSVTDLRGGGDLFAYRFLPGPGGSADVLLSPNSYALIPNFDGNVLPFAPFAADPTFGGDRGYAQGNLRIGDQVFLDGSPGLPAGSYTLLPARYALLPGAVLATPQTGSPVGSFRSLDGSYLTTGYRFNRLNPGQDDTQRVRWEIAPGDVVRRRSQYEEFSGNQFFVTAAQALNQAPPRLPRDSGRLLLQASSNLALGGSILGRSSNGGRGALVDLNSPRDIYIGTNRANAAADSLFLDVQTLNNIGTESLLIGGFRDGNQVTTSTGKLTLDNAGTPLVGSDIILLAKNDLQLLTGASLQGTGSLTADRLIFGNATAGSGNGLMVRASGDVNATAERRNVVPTTTSLLTVRDGVRLSGGSISVDSSAGTSLSDQASFAGNTLNLSSGQISIQLQNPGALQSTNSLTLSGATLAGLASGVGNLNLVSYSALDLYGTGTVSIPQNLSLSAPALRGFNQAGGSITIQADRLQLNNTNNSTALPGLAPATGDLRLIANQIILGTGNVAISQFRNVSLESPSALQLTGTGGLNVAGNLTGQLGGIITGAATNYALNATGAVRLDRATGASSIAPGSLGGRLSIEGAQVALKTDILLPSGLVSVRSLAGPLEVGGRIVAGGTQQRLNDITRYTDGGRIQLSAAGGDIILTDTGVLDVSAVTAGGNAGSIALAAPTNHAQLNGRILGTAGASGLTGSFSLDTATLADVNLLASQLDAGGFTESRTFRVRTGDVAVTGTQNARNFRLTADAGSIAVSGVINAAGRTGGSIELIAHRNLTLTNTAQLLATGQTFDNAGKGGRISLQAGAQTNAVIPADATLDLQSGSRIDLSVASLIAGDAITPGSSAFNGRFAGTLHLRAPQNTAGTDLALSSLGSTVTGASAIQLEGYRLIDLTTSGGLLTTAVQDQVKAEGTTFGNASDAILTRLLGSNSARANLTVVSPGAEIINRTGSLTLGTTTSTATSDWNLASFRFGPRLAPGVLTLRAAQDLVFLNSLSDGFAGGPNLWLSPLIAQNPNLPVNLQSYSLNLTAGADLNAAHTGAVTALSSLAPNKGSLLLGKNYTNASFVNGANGLTATAIDNGNRLQVIRTGSGDINVNAGRDVQILNTFASIYTAGTQVAKADTLFSSGDFQLPVLTGEINRVNVSTGLAQQEYPAQYALAGGNVSLRAGADIARYTFTDNSTSALRIDDASRQIPGNWLYRRGFIDPLTGESGLITTAQGTRSVTDPRASTTWWVDYSNFFQSVGTLGGGNVSLLAGNHVSNVDAVAPTNARAAAGRPDPEKFVELGGGDITIRSGADIYGGTYYVERGRASLVADGSITLRNSPFRTISSFNPRSPTTGIVGSLTAPTIASPEAWIPTLGFLGRGSFDYQANADLLLGPVTNAFLNPAGVNNKFWYKTYFSTFGEESRVNALSLNGNITHRLAVTLPAENSATGTLQAWISSQNGYTVQNSTNSANFQPWLRISDTRVNEFSTAASLQPATLLSTALAGSINLSGPLTLSPSRRGGLELTAAQNISGLSSTGLGTLNATPVFAATRINLSDASPSAIPSALNPLAIQNVLTRSSTGATNFSETQRGEASFYPFFDVLFNESGSLTGAFSSTQTKQSLHDASILHRDDRQPVRLQALLGDVSGITLFSPKVTQVFAGRDITDASFYVQNLRSSDLTSIVAGRDILPYNPNSLLRQAVSRNAGVTADADKPLVGDIQVGGPGNVEILAGRNITLGTTPAQPDGTGDGISTIGNLRNPFLPIAGANVILAAGVSATAGLSTSNLNLTAFVNQIATTPEGATILQQLGLTNADVSTLSDAEKSRLALAAFYGSLRAAGRSFATVGNYDIGFTAIQSLFGGRSSVGSVNLSSRSLRTRNGGDISIAAPSGGLSLGNNLVSGTTPPGIISESGGGINIFARDSVDVGVFRIFTLRGGDITIWSSNGNVAAGSSSRTVAAAPPTRVLIDSNTAVVATDLAGLSTGGGIGVLATVKNVPPGNVDLIAPNGAVDAGDAGIRSSGNLTIAAATVLNAGSISVSGTSVGAPAAPSVAAPSVSAPPAPPANQTAAAPRQDAQKAAANNQQSIQSVQPPDPLSNFTVKVLGYGGSDTSAPADPQSTDEDEEAKRRKKASEASSQDPSAR